MSRYCPREVAMKMLEKIYMHPVLETPTVANSVTQTDPDPSTIRYTPRELKLYTQNRHERPRISTAFAFA
jgi:hypothetical protein